MLYFLKKFLFQQHFHSTSMVKSANVTSNTMLFFINIQIQVKIIILWCLFTKSIVKQMKMFRFYYFPNQISEIKCKVYTLNALQMPKLHFQNTIYILACHFFSLFMYTKFGVSCFILIRKIHTNIHNFVLNLPQNFANQEYCFFRPFQRCIILKFVSFNIYAR